MSDGYRPPYRVAGAASRLGLSDYQTRQAVKRGVLDAFRVGHTLLIRPQSVDRLLQGDREPRAAGDDAA